MLCPRYIAEVSPPVIRGALSCATQLSICLGLLMSYLLGLPFEYGITAISVASYTVHWWRAVHVLGALTSLIQVQTTIPCALNSHVTQQPSLNPRPGVNHMQLDQRLQTWLRHQLRLSRFDMLQLGPATSAG